jgi:hypothetical protein
MSTIKNGGKKDIIDGTTISSICVFWLWGYLYGRTFTTLESSKRGMEWSCALLGGNEIGDWKMWLNWESNW